MKALLTDPKWTFVRFLVIGIVNTAFGYLLFALLLYAGLRPQPALALAFGGGVAWNYLTHARLVFGTRGVSQLPPYVLAYLMIYGVNAGGLQALMAAGVAPIIAQAVLVPPMAVLAYILIGRVLTGRFPWSADTK